MAIIELTQGYSTQVDDSDLEKINKHKWYYNCGYVKTNDYSDGHKSIKLHRYIIDAPEGFVVDHINGDKLDNRRENLRICTQDGNNKNARKRAKATSSFKGVSFFKRGNYERWKAQIQYNKKKIAIGYFKTQKEAACAYDSKAKELFGEFAVLNFESGEL